MSFFRSAIVVLLIVITTSCASREKFDDTNRTSKNYNLQTEDHFNFIEHGTIPAAGSLYNINDTFVGSCVLVTPSVALTAGHCITMGKLKYARFGNEEIMIDLQCLHKNHDLGDDLGLLILKTESTHQPMSMVDDVSSIPKMYPIHTVAHGSGKKKMSKDKVYHYYGILNNRLNEIIFLPIQTSVWFGDSGGALVYKNKEGTLVLIGIITHFSTVDGDVYECAARRTDNFDLTDDIWQPWFAK